MIGALPEEVLQHFMKGDHVMRHIPGLWNGLWSDMFIETTFMQYGHGKAGIIGITLKPETLKTWALSLHVCGQLLKDLSTLRDNERPSSIKKKKKNTRKKPKQESLLTKLTEGFSERWYQTNEGLREEFTRWLL